MLVGAGAASSAQTPDADFPNLPQRMERLSGGSASSLVSSYTTNTAYVAPSKQWIRMLDLKVTADTLIMVVPDQVARCHAYYGSASPRCVNDRPEINARKLPLRALAYPNNFEGDDPASPPANRDELRRFGAEFTHFPSQRIRTVGFGALPVEATVHMRLATDEAGLPIGIQIDADQFGAGVGVLTDSIGTGRLVLRLSDVSVDGSPVDVGQACEAPGDLEVRGSGFRTGGPQPPGHYNPREGGRLQGSLEVGEFSGCGTGAEDLSSLINTMAGGSTVPVRADQGEVFAFCFSDNLRRAITESSCNTGGDGPFPDEDAFPPLPDGILPPPDPRE